MAFTVNRSIARPFARPARSADRRDRLRRRELERAVRRFLACR